jgi:hypothetical protein
MGVYFGIGGHIGKWNWQILTEEKFFAIWDTKIRKQMRM